MEPTLLEPEKDPAKARFQEELNRWFESRGIITDLRSHLRHLMVSALQNAQLGVKPTEGSSPKCQALSLIVAEYLFRHSCHYTLSVFTSEVPTLANFNPGGVLRGGKRSDDNRRLSGVCFQDKDIEEIFNALGMSSREEDLTFLKASYLEKGNQISLLELFLQAVIAMSTKLQVRQNLESLTPEEGGRLLSKKWSTKVADILLAENMSLPQITAVEEAIFRITERELKKIMEEERRLELQKLTNRERRIQEYWRKQEDYILVRLLEAEKDLRTRKGIIDEELTERHKHLTRMAVEWNDKHEEIVRLSKTFHNVENENKRLQRKVKELEEENSKLKTQEQSQSRTMDALRGEMELLRTKLKEVTESNVTLSERVKALMSRENMEVSVPHEEGNQETEREVKGDEIPLLWPRTMTLDDLGSGRRISKEEPESRPKGNELPVKIRAMSPLEQRNIAAPTKPQFRCTEAELNQQEVNLSSPDEEDVSLSQSSEEIITEVRKKLQNLEEETNRINQNYLEFKLKCISPDSSSETLSNESDKPKPQPKISEKSVLTETKFCQTVSEDIHTKIYKLEERKEKKEPDYVLIKKLEEVSPKMPAMRIPTKRQLLNRDFFLKNRQLLHELERQNQEDLHPATPSIIESPTLSSGEEVSRSFNKVTKKSPERSVLLTPLRTASFYCNEPEVEKSPESSAKNKSKDGSDKFPKDDMDCLALLEETRLKSPQVSGRKSLRQQILLSEDEDKISNGPKSVSSSQSSPLSGRLSAAKKSGSESFW